MPRSFHRVARVPQRRLTQWLEMEPNVTTHTAVGGTILFSLTTAEKALRPFTIIRTRILASIISDQVAVSERQIGALGIAVVSDQAEAIGVTAVPTPITDMASDLWLMHQLMYNEISVQTAVGIQQNPLEQYAIDSKAMRKVNDGEDVVVVAELSSTAGSEGFNLNVGGRILVKLH